ncbi:MAG TPA: nucleoside triphosphate pyrophosphohydrolase [Candidatus Acidoferrales bacterium]|nr:nucleoside triphosphate pyrophosphohydrolase [Candidatus Acidoferrales bacterium]
MSAGEAFAELVRIMERLRGPGGCPWDREQTRQSIKPYVIEEAYEVAEAIEDDNIDELRTELGDLLLQIVFHAELAREEGLFTIEDVIGAITEKMIRRHPHVFSDTEVKDSAEVLRNWARIKAEERKDHEDRSHVAGVPRAMPALLRAHRLSEKASRVGFDWENAGEVFDKVHEEVTELQAAVALGDPAAVEAELGDVLFALTSLGRHLDVQAEDALQRANDRFIRRFRYIEARLAERQQDLHQTSVQEMNTLWEEAKGKV